MKQIVLGVACFFAGVAAALFLMRNSAQTSPRGEPAAVSATIAPAGGASSSGSSETPAAQARSLTFGDSVADSRGPSDAGLPIAGDGGVDSAASTAAERATRSGGDRGAPEGAKNARNDGATDASRRFRRIPLPSGMKLGGNMASLHEYLENQPDDFAWSDVTEGELGQYFASLQGLDENFSLPTVICRETTCEVQAIGYGPGSFENWQQRTTGMSEQPWARQFTEINIAANTLSPDVQGIVLILTRPPGVSPPVPVTGTEPRKAIEHTQSIAAAGSS